MNKAIQNIILLSILVVPLASIIPIHGTIVWYPQLLSLMALAFVFIAMLWWGMNKFISIFFIYITFSYLFICNQSPRSMLCLIVGASGLLLSYFVSQCESKKIYQALLAISVINVIFIIFQVFKLDPIFTTQTNILIDRTVGFMGSRNQLGIFHASASLLLIAISPWFLALSFPILLVKCSSAFAGLMVGISAYFGLIGRKMVSIIIALVLLISIPVFIHLKSEVLEELKERASLWSLTINQTVKGELTQKEKINPEGEMQIKIKCNPWLGYGLGSFFVLSPSSQGSIWNFNHPVRYEHAHNDLVEDFFEFGYIGLGLLILCICKVISDFISCFKFASRNLIANFSALIGISVCSLGIYVFHAPVSLFLFCLTLGLFYGEVRHARQSQII